MWTRRRFLSTAATAGLAAAMPRRARAVSANETIVVAHIGVGGMGNAHLSWFAGMGDTAIAAVCDIDSNRLAAAVDRVSKMRPEGKVEGYSDFRRILDRDDIDVVTYATPDHWHAPLAIMAFQAGKDVYGEKPLAHRLHEADVMQRMRRRYGRVFQLGTQIHAGENYHRVVELVRSGALGTITEAHLWKTGGSSGLGFPPDSDPPPELDWDMWLGPAPWRPWNKALCPYTWRHFWDYSGGVYADFWCHVADLAFWALQPGEPRTIEAVGTTPTDGIAETPRTIDVRYEFDGLVMTWSDRNPNLPGTQGMDLGVQFVGERGTLIADYGSRRILLDGEELNDLPDVPRTLPRSPGHQRNFLDCVRSREQPESNLDYVRNMTLPLFLGEISFRLRRPLQWDSAKQEVTGDDLANRLLTKPYRPPWSLPA